MAKLLVCSLLSIVLLGNVSKCRGISLQTCAESEHPVCATDDANWYYFKNVCRLNSENKNRENNGLEKLQLTDITNCFQKCDQICNKELAPICATNDEDERETFVNKCEFDLENCRYGNIWKVLHEGECPTERQLNYQINLQQQDLTVVTDSPDQLIQHPINRRCPTHCTLEYNPVCATFDGVDQTFENQCTLRADICATKRAWAIKNNGECSENCNNCPKIFSPMCATYNGHNKTFDNECLIDLEICISGNSWEILYNGKCRNSIQNCPKICPSDYEPVCASYNGAQKTFPNQCFVQIETCKATEDWKILHKGQCKTEEIIQSPSTCPDVCPAIYSPVCAEHQGLKRTFSNDCELDIYKCKSGQNWITLFTGQCDNEDLPPNRDIPILACPDCSNAYKPVCGLSNGQERTFNNECLMLSENCYSNTNWVVAYEGVCHSLEGPLSCPNFCPLNYEPVCGIFNGVSRTFPNECELNYEAYRTNKEWVILNFGECDYCPTCSNDIAPVCAELNGQKRTFENGCKVESENCKNNENWKIVSRSACEIHNCPKICPRIYLPVCGISNGEARTFDNICEMRKEACNTNTVWNIASKGECPLPNENCPSSCSLQYNPVCATYDGVCKEFINECFLRSEVCKTHKNWEFVNAGPCVGSSKSLGTDLEEVTIIPTTQVSDLETTNCQLTKCLAFRDPLCAIFNGEEKTFSNACFLSNFVCKTGEDWKIVRSGNCRRTPRSLN